VRGLMSARSGLRPDGPLSLSPGHRPGLIPEIDSDAAWKVALSDAPLPDLQIHIPVDLGQQSLVLAPVGLQADVEL
jgi:hypothetical protein